MLDNLAPATTLVALHLHLLEHTRRQLMLHNPHTVSATSPACIDNPVGGTRALTFLANLLFIPLELGRAPIVEVAQGDSDLDLDVRAAALAGLVAEVPAAAEEAAEEVEGVVVVEAAALLALLETLVAVLVVDLARLGVDQGLVGFGDFDELFFYCVIPTDGSQVFGQQEGRRDIGKVTERGRFTGSCQDGISCSIACMQT